MKTPLQRMMLIKSVEKLAISIHTEKYGNPKLDKNRKHFAECRELAAKQLGLL